MPRSRGASDSYSLNSARVGAKMEQEPDGVFVRVYVSACACAFGSTI